MEFKLVETWDVKKEQSTTKKKGGKKENERKFESLEENKDSLVKLR